MFEIIKAIEAYQNEMRRELGVAVTILKIVIDVANDRCIIVTEEEEDDNA